MMALHEALDAWFFAHQVALLDRDYARAAQALDGYQQRLLRHAADEERHVLPVYVQLGGDTTDAPLRLFLGEHQKMRDFVAEFGRRVAALQAQPDDRALLELFDREATFKNLALHHDLRERNMLYPFVGARLDAEAQQRVWSQIAWQGDP
jgi:hemerythrin-like domain-containing protein